MQAKIMTTVAMAVVTLAACGVDGDGVTTQAVAGPSVTVAPRPDPSQLAVSWTAVAGASAYQVFETANGGPAMLAATLTGAPPSTSYVADGLTAGARYCFALVVVLSDGSASDVSAAVCAVIGTGGSGPAQVTITFPIPASNARVTTANPAATLQGPTGWLVIGTGELIYPLPVQVGDAITSFRVFGNKQSSSATRLAATVMAVQSSNGVASGSMTASNQTSAPGPITLQPPTGAVPVQAGFSYIIEADSTTGIQQDIWRDAEITVLRPSM